MKVNGREMSFSKSITIANLLLNLNISIEKVVVEVDGEIISRDEFNSFILNENNSIEVISFVGGG